MLRRADANNFRNTAMRLPKNPGSTAIQVILLTRRRGFLSYLIFLKKKKKKIGTAV